MHIHTLNNRIINPYTSKKLIYFIIFTILLFSVLYIIEVNKISYFGYKIRDYKYRLNELNEINRRLEAMTASKQSLFNLKEASTSLDMVNAGKFNYIVVKEETLGIAK